VLSHGGNSSVIQRIESGEKKVGIVLLENILASKEKGSKIEAIYPKEGGVAIPSMQVILKGGGNNEGARKFGEFMISDAGQALVTKGFMYPANKKLPGPATAKPFKEATNISKLWTESDLKKIGSQHKEIKKQFQTLVLD
jgi:iron(III) transport system substrate-binding protein